MACKKEGLRTSAADEVLMARVNAVVILFVILICCQVFLVCQPSMAGGSSISGGPCFVLNITQELGGMESSLHDEDANNEAEYEDMCKEFGEEEIKEYMKDVENMPGIFLPDDNNKENIPEISKKGGKSEKEVAFLDLDEVLVNEVRAAGRKFDKIEWARTRFDQWRVKKGLALDKKIEELDLREFARMLEPFMLQVCKIKGGLYPTETLQDIFRKFGAIIRRNQEVRVGITGIEEVPFDIRHSPIFSNARKACVASMRRSRLAPGVCGKRKKVDEVSFSDEVALLCDIEHSIFSNRGLQRRFMYYCVSRFAIRGRDELYKLVVTDFQVLVVEDKECLEYSERLSKNYDVSMKKYQEESFRLPVRCFEDDVVLTFKCLVRHLPCYGADEQGSNFVFMQCINCPKGTVWYNKKHRVSARVLASWMKYMLKTIGVEGKFSGKSGRTSVVSRLARANVPIDVGMNITGHRDPESYKRYDKTSEIKSKAAMSIIGQPFKADGSRRMFDDVYNEELAAYDARQNAGNVVDCHSVVSGHATGDDLKQGVVGDGLNVVKDATLNLAPKSVELASNSSAKENQNIISRPAAVLDDPFFDTISLEEIAGDNQRLRKAFNLSLDVGTTNISGGTFNNCIILPGGGNLNIAEIVKRISGSDSGS